MVNARYLLAPTPGVEVRAFWSSEAAKTDGSFNLAGIARPGRRRPDRQDPGGQKPRGAATASRALDRVLRAGHYWVPHWYKAVHTVATWDKIPPGRPSHDYERGILIRGGTTRKRRQSSASDKLTAVMPRELRSVSGKYVAGRRVSRDNISMCTGFARYCLSLFLSGAFAGTGWFQIFTIICGLPDDSHKTGDGVP